jgi:hypothetical protein
MRSDNVRSCRDERAQYVPLCIGHVDDVVNRSVVPVLVAGRPEAPVGTAADNVSVWHRRRPDRTGGARASMGVHLLEGNVMAAALPVTVMEPSEIAVAGFLARYREPTLSAYRRDLLCYWQWCAEGPPPALVE